MTPESKPLPGKLMFIENSCLKSGCLYPNLHPEHVSDSQQIILILPTDLESYIKQREERAFEAGQINVAGQHVAFRYDFKSWTESEEYKK